MEPILSKCYFFATFLLLKNYKGLGTNFEKDVKVISSLWSSARVLHGDQCPKHY
jgi:hypothetical protein